MWKLVEKLLFGHILSFPMYPNSPPPLPHPSQGYSMNLWLGICHWGPRALNFAARELPKSLAIDHRVAVNAFFAIELGCR